MRKLILILPLWAIVVIASAIPAVFVINCTVNGEVQSKKKTLKYGPIFDGLLE